MIEGIEVAEAVYIERRLVHTFQQGSDSVVVRVGPLQAADKAVEDNLHGSDPDLPHVVAEVDPVGDKVRQTGHTPACLGVR